VRAKVKAEEYSALHLKVPNGDDYVPQLNTSNGVSAIASAFGSQVQDTGGGHWAGKLIRDLVEVDRMEKPPVTAGLVGEALEHTRWHGSCPTYPSAPSTCKAR